jgi:ABC-type branched-subunit amino acid transport system ATPase component
VWSGCNLRLAPFELGKVCVEIAAALRRLRDEMGLTIGNTEQNANFALTSQNAFMCWKAERTAHRAP